MHALIIEDMALLALCIEDDLRKLGFKSFDHAGHEAEAIALAAARCPDLITADVRLTSGSGVIAVREICQHQAIPVVFIVGNPADVDELPGAIILTKPVVPNELKAAVQQAVEMVA